MEKATELAQQFQRMVQKRLSEVLENWLRACFESKLTDLRTFTEGIGQGKEAARGAPDEVA